MSRLDDLQALLACLRGELPAGDRWTSIIEMANNSLCTPLVARRFKETRRFSSLPADVQSFLEEIQSRNAERNRRLYGQLDEAAKLLNARDLQPVLLKGTAWLASAEPERRSDRLLADLDMMVPAERVDEAVDQLAGAGYRPLEPADHQGGPVVLFRPTDAATIDLHTDYGSATTLHYRHGDLVADGILSHLGEGAVYVPSAVSGVAILLLHDQLKGRDYLRGRIDLRHLLDIQSLAAGFDMAAWQKLDGLFAAGYARSAARTQLLTAKRLLGVPVPAAMVGTLRAKLQFKRRMLQIRWPASALSMTLLSLLDPQYLLARRTWRSATGLAGGRGAGALKWFPRRMSVERLLSWKEVGKI